MEEIGKIIELNTISRDGNTTTISHSDTFPFDIKRTYWTYDVPSGESRGGHAHKQCLEILIAVTGSFTVILDNGKEQKQYLLHRSDQGLLIDKGIWRTLEDFSAGAVCLVLASERYDKNDYIYEYKDFLKYVSYKKHDNHQEIRA